MANVARRTHRVHSRAARRGIHPGPMKDEACWRDHATWGQERIRADAVRSPAECAPRQAFLFEKHTDDDRSCDDKGGSAYPLACRFHQVRKNTYQTPASVRKARQRLMTKSQGTDGPGSARRASVGVST